MCLTRSLAEEWVAYLIIKKRDTISVLNNEFINSLKMLN